MNKLGTCWSTMTIEHSKYHIVRNCILAVFGLWMIGWNKLAMYISIFIIISFVLYTLWVIVKLEILCWLVILQLSTDNITLICYLITFINFIQCLCNMRVSHHLLTFSFDQGMKVNTMDSMGFVGLRLYSVLYVVISRIYPFVLHFLL